MNASGAERDLRVLILAPTAKDAEITAQLLRGTGIETDTCASLAALVDAATEGAASILVPEECLSGALKAPLAAMLAKQPPWSDLPILILTRPGADSPEATEAWRTLGNVTLIERPTRVSTLLSAAQTAVRARARQYQIRGHLAERLRNEKALRAADRRKDEFLATLGHELRNPLAPILNSLEILKLSGAAAEGGASQACAVMDRQVHHLNRLVDDLLEVSRITRGIIEVKKEPQDLVAVVRAAIDTSRPVLEGFRHEDAAGAGWAGNWPDARQEPRRHARRVRGGQEQRSRPGQRVRRPVAAAGRRGEAGSRADDRAAAAAAHVDCGRQPRWRRKHDRAAAGARR